MTWADPVAAVVARLVADPAVFALTKRVTDDSAGRAMVFGGGEINRDLLPVAAMPLPCVVVGAAGGPGTSSRLPEIRQRVDIRCYGGSSAEAMQVWLAVAESLDQLGREARGGGLIQSAFRVSDAIQRREPPPENWPVAVGVWTVIVGTPPIELP